MQGISWKPTYPLSFDIEMDVLCFLHYNKEVARFSEILKFVISQRGEDAHSRESLKALLADCLKTLQNEKLVSRKKRSHKFVQYSIQNEKKAEWLLQLRRPDSFSDEKDQLAFIGKKTSIKDLHGQFVIDFASTLLRYEELACRMLIDDSLIDSRLIVQGRALIVALWDSFFSILSERRPEVKDFYERKLQQTQQNVFACLPIKDKIDVESWIDAWKDGHRARLRFYECLLESFAWCTRKTESVLNRNRSVSEEQLRENSLKGLASLVRSLDRSSDQ